MFIDLHDLDEAGVRFDESLALADLALGAGEPATAEGVRLAGRARPGKRGVEFRARLSGTLQLPCSRCLERYASPLDENIDLVLVPAVVEFGTGEARMDPQDADLFSCEGGRADLAAIAVEQVYLSLPLKPLCQTACRGLCPSCGSNRNRIECRCAPETPDPRLAPLLELKERLRS